MHDDFSILFLGTGTSAGVPMIACDCPVCTSSDPRDARSRSSIYISAGGLKILVDTSPDFRLQAIAHNIRRIDHLLVTHSHVDHLFGLDDIRRINTVQKTDIPLHATPKTIEDVKRIFGYVFKEAVPGTYRPKLALAQISGRFSFQTPSGGGITIDPVPVVHGWTETIGFAFSHAGRRMAYVPDCHEIPPASMDLLRGLDLLIIDCLKHSEHPTHLSLAMATSIAAELAPRRVLLTHIGHDLGHEALTHELADKGLAHISPAFDGLVFDMAKEFPR